MDFLKHIYLASSAMMIFIGAIFPGVASCQTALLKICAILFLVSVMFATIVLFIDTANYELLRDKKKILPDENKIKRCAFLISILSFALGCVVLLIYLLTL